MTIDASQHGGFSVKKFAQSIYKNCKKASQETSELVFTSPAIGVVCQKEETSRYCSACRKKLNRQKPVMQFKQYWQTGLRPAPVIGLLSPDNQGHPVLEIYVRGKLWLSINIAFVLISVVQVVNYSGSNFQTHPIFPCTIIP